MTGETMVWTTVKMILALGAILGLLWALTRLVRRQGGRLMPASGTGIRIIASQPIGPQKFISLVEIGGDLFAIAVSESRISLLTKVENRAFLEKTADRAGIRPEPISALHSFFNRPNALKMGLTRGLRGK
jgi:flagellar biosynthetic protein FliO